MEITDALRIYKALIRGESKDSFGEMDDEMSAFWDQIAAEMAQDPKGTVMWDIPDL